MQPQRQAAANSHTKPTLRQVAPVCRPLREVETDALIHVLFATSCCGPLGRYSLIDRDTPAKSRCCKACAINTINSTALALLQPASLPAAIGLLLIFH